MKLGATELSPEDLACPLATLLNLFEAREWPCHMRAPGELVGEIQASWAKYQLRAIWREDDRVMQFLCLPDIRVSEDKLASAYELVGLINEQVWLGHFEIWSQGGVALYRHGVMLGDEHTLGLRQAQDVIEAAIAECDRFYPAFQFVLWAGKGAQAALDSALVDAAGEA